MSPFYSFLKNYIIFSGVVGLYGFTRGYRCRTIFNYKNNDFQRRLLGDKILLGMTNGIFYVLFPIPYCLALINRLQLYFNKEDKQNHKMSYLELTGYCTDTI